MIYYNSTGSTVKSPLVPAGSNATHYDMFGVGGYREVDTLNDLHYINSKLLLTGCLVYVRSENEIYKYEGSGNFKILYYDKWLQLEECVKNIKSLLLEDAKLWKAVNANIENINVLLLEVNTNTLNITELTNKLDSLDFKNYELSLNQSSDKNSVVLKYKKDNSITTADLPIATKNTPGEIKLGDSTLFDSTNTKNYPVLLDNNNRAYVNVPWSDTVTKSNTYRIAFKTPSKNIAHSIELSGSDSSTSSADIPIASETLLGEIKLGNPNLLGKNKCYPLQYNDNDGAYVQVPWTDTVTNPEDITTQFTSFVFTRSTTNPGQPEGGTYNNPIPTNTNSKGELIWSDGIPEGENPVWSSNAIFTNKNVTSIIWSEPILLTDSSSVDICYSNSSTRPDPPTIHGTQNDSVWHNDAQTDDIWMAISTKTSVIKDWSNWEIFRIKGENGKDGNSIVGSQGALGIQGCVLRNRGYWKSDINDYINEGEYTPTSAIEIRYIDYVFLKDTNKCYKVKYAHEIPSLNGVINGKVTVKDSTSPDKSEYWTEATSLEFAYIRDLVAELINAKTITADEFLVKRKLTDNSTQIVAGMVKGDTNTTKTEDNVVFFAGTSATDTSNLNIKEAKTYITEGGTLHSEDADITGNVQASRLIVNANTINPGKDDKVTPSIIFTTYQDSTKVYSYERDGTPKNPVLMSTFNNLKDSNGNGITKGSPIGIVYALENNTYVPKYFFDFAPLVINAASSVSGYYFNLGDSNLATILSYNKKLYKNSTDSSNLLSGDIWSKLDTVYISNYEGHLQEACIWFCKKASNGEINDTSTYKWGVQKKYTYVSTGKTYTKNGLSYPLYDRINSSDWLTTIDKYDNIKSSSDQYPTSSTNYNTLHFMKDYWYPVGINYDNGYYYYFKLLAYDFGDLYNHPVVLDLDSIKDNAQIIKFSSNNINSLPQALSDISSGDDIILGVSDLMPESQIVDSSSDIYTKVFYIGINRHGYDYIIGKE